MYWQHFGLSAEPFSLTPDPAFLYMSEGHAEALAALKLGLLERRGLLAMIGEVGTGKTTLLYSLLAGLEAEIKTAYVSNTRLSFDGILRTILGDFGVTPVSQERVDMLDALNEFLVECAEQDTTAALIIDEAQNLSPDAFEEIRLLSNFETYTTKLLQIVLVGQPELATKLNQRELRQINERIAVRCCLNPLTEVESRSYIEHRLEAAGGSIEVFSKRALNNIIAWSSGIPRRINILCHNSLLFAYGRSLTSVTPGIVEDAIRDQEGAGLRRFDQPARYEDPGLRDAVAIAVDAAGKQVRGRFGLERRPALRWALGATAVGIAAAALLASGHTEDRAVAATPAAARVNLTAPVLAPRPAIEANSAGERELRSQRRADRRRRSETTRTAEPAPYTGLSPEVKARLEQALARLDAAALAAPVRPTLVEPAGQSAEPVVQSAEPAVRAAEPVGRAAEPEADAGTVAVMKVAAPGSGPAGVSSQRETPQIVERVIAVGTSAGAQIEIEAPPGAHVATVPAGSTLSDLMVDVYGFYRTDLLGAVRAANPHIADPDRIQAGETVILPELATIAIGSVRGENR